MALTGGTLRSGVTKCLHKNRRSLPPKALKNTNASIRPAFPEEISPQPDRSFRSFPHRTSDNLLSGFRRCVVKTDNFYHDAWKTASSQQMVFTGRPKSTLTNQEQTLAANREHVGELPNQDAITTSDNSGTIRGASETFDNYRIGYGSKSTWELVRALSFFFLCRFPHVTDNAVKLMTLSYRLMGRRTADFLIRKTAYDQFVAGDTTQAIMDVVTKLRHGNVRAMLCVPVESDARLGDGQTTKDMFLDDNLKKILDMIKLSTMVDDPHPMIQYRYTALICGDLLKVISTFCGKTLHNMEVIRGISASLSGQKVDFNKLPGWENFPREKTEEFRRGLERIKEVNEAMKSPNLIALTDAELTDINPALRLLGLSVMNVYNKDRARVFYTYQAYLKKTLKELTKDLEFAKENGFCFGVKLVRGAYMVKERQMAHDLGYEDPVNESHDMTCVSYHNCLDLLLDKVTVAPPLSVRFIIASHNEDTMRHAMKRMDELGIARDGPSVFFGQLYGMADHVSFTLGHRGYRIYKSIPYGSIGDTLPYLARRAQENKAILVNARRERRLVARTLRDRVMLRA